jgi:3-phosphoshikimate 1-carboxyvinyltransferase
MKRLRTLPLPQAVKTEVMVSGSKSYTNRALFLAALTPGKVRISNPLISDDTESMLSCLQALGIKMARKPAYIDVTGDISSVKDRNYELDAGLSGITLRFMLALCPVIPGRQVISGQAGLNKRPVGDMVKSLRSLGADIEYLGETGHAPLRVNSSNLVEGTVKLPGSESSQYLSALLMVAPPAGDISVEVTGKLISKPYVDMTIETMEKFGVHVRNTDYRKYQVSGRYSPADYVVEGDISSASYFFAIAALTESTITVKDINPRSRQADMGFLEILERMGSKVTRGKSGVTVKGSGVRPLNADMRDCPDQAQTLAVLAAFADGKTTITGIKSLRVKETERVKALERELQNMGIKTSSAADTLIIRGGNPRAGAIHTYGDHRMAMSFAVAGAKLPGMIIEDPGVVSKTFPAFWEKLAEIGVRTEVIEPNIVLIGMRGSGKTTVARKLARKLGINHIDLDEIMAQRLTLSTPEIVQQHGWGYFRNQESRIAEEVSAVDNQLISTGGGVVLKPRNVAALKRNGTLILLRASAAVLIKRLGDARDRPPLTKASSLEVEVKQVLRERQEVYEAAADIIIDTDDLKAEQVADRIIAELGREPR